MKTSSSIETKGMNFFKIVLFGGLIVGSLDIIAASVQTLIDGRSPVSMLKFIASGVFGREAFSDDMRYAWYGLFFHYCIATIWTAIFYILYTRLTVLTKNWIVTGIGYGLIVKFGMSQIVLPLSNTPDLPFTVKGAIISSLILIAAIGLPLSFMANKLYKPYSNG